MDLRQNIHDAMFKLTHFINDAIGNDEHCLLVLCDLAKAFASLYREIMLKKFKLLRIWSKTSEWFKSYFETHV